MQAKHTSLTRLAACAAVLLAAVALAACGSSSPGTTTAARSSAATATNPRYAGRGRFEAVRECLQKQGIALPQRVPGGKRPPAGSAGPLGGGAFQGLQLPKGVSRARFEAALKKCGGVRGGFGAPGRLRSPAFTKALAKFAECMRSNGIAVPKPNTSGNGPIFSTKGLNANSAKFRAARAKCSTLLRFATPGGREGPPPGGSALPPEGAPGR